MTAVEAGGEELSVGVCVGGCDGSFRSSGKEACVCVCVCGKCVKLSHALELGSSKVWRAFANWGGDLCFTCAPAGALAW